MLPQLAIAEDIAGTEVLPQTLEKGEGFSLPINNSNLPNDGERVSWVPGNGMKMKEKKLVDDDTHSGGYNEAARKRDKGKSIVEMDEEKLEFHLKNRITSAPMDSHDVKTEANKKGKSVSTSTAECLEALNNHDVISFLSQIKGKGYIHTPGQHVFNINSVTIYNELSEPKPATDSAEPHFGAKKDGKGNPEAVDEGDEGSSLSRKRMRMGPPLDHPQPLDSFRFALNSLLSQSSNQKDQFAIFWEEMKAKHIQLFGNPINDPTVTPAVHTEYEAPASNNPQGLVRNY